MLAFPYGRIGLGDIELAELDFIVDRNVELHIIAWSEFDRLVAIDRFEHQFFDKGGDVLIADDTQFVSLLVARADTAGYLDVEPQASSAVFDRVGGESPANRGAGR